MNYIYGYQNKINNKWYVGQTTMPIKERHRLHLSGATHEKSSDYNSLFHKKIRQYGIENFDLIILEEVENKENLDDKEKYWIKEKHSFIRDSHGPGYNLTAGGQIRKINEDFWDSRCSLTKEQVLEIIEILKNSNTPQTEIAKQYNINVSIINQINSGKKYRLLNENQYPIRKQIKKITSQEDLLIIIELLKQGYGNVEISEMLEYRVSDKTISAINIGEKHKQENIEYPIRKETNIKIKRKNDSNKIKELLENTELNFQEIANIVGCDRSCVSRINSGKNYKDSMRTYPIRKPKI